MLDFSNPVNPLAAAACLFATFMTASLLTRAFATPSEQGRFASIDGLRGYLAISVFIHHASIWFYYRQTGHWALPPSRLYSHLGQSSVELFFMITSFLFIRKITFPKSIKPTSWQTLFVHRVFRLTPLYLFAMACFFALVVWLSGGQRTESWLRIASESTRWLLFSLGGMESINGVNAGLIVAWVPWSLQYEWVFYLSLPLIALIIGRKVPPTVVAGTIVLILLASVRLPEAGRFFYGFAGGAVAAYVVQSSLMQRIARWRISSLIVVALLYGTVHFFDSAYSVGATIMLTIAMTLIACGTNLFGLLVRPSAFFLGESAYSIYLLHPFFLFVGIGLVSTRFSVLWVHPWAYWLVIAAMTPLLVFVCVLTYRYIELPGIATGPRVDAWLRTTRGRWKTSTMVGRA